MLFLRYFCSFAILFLLAITHLYGQNSLLITVFDEKTSALEGASITTYPAQDTYFTDALGQAKIPICDSLYITYLGLQSTLISWETAHEQKGQIILSGSGLALPEVVVGAQAYRRDLSQQQVRISALDIQRVQANTPAAALSSTAGAFVQMSQLGGGSPVLRGFEANRVLLVIDGVRMNNAIYRSGHLQNAITIDENALSTLDVSYGPGALAYGSDAIGGLIHFKTKNPLPTGQSTANWSGALGLRIGSAARESGINAELTYQSAKWSSYTVVSASQFGDLRAGEKRPEAYPDFGKRPTYAERINGNDVAQINDDPNRQIGSGYDQIDVLQKFNWQPHKRLLIGANLQYSSSSNVPRYDRLTEMRNGQLRFAEWYYGPQDRAMAAITANYDAEQFWADQIRLIISTQAIAEDRFDRSFGSPWREESLVDVSLSAITLDAHKKLRKQSSLQYGLELRTETVESSSLRRSLEDDTVIRDVNSRYPSKGSSLESYSAYIQHRYHNIDSSFLWEVGGRWTQRRLFAQFSEEDPIAWPTPYLLGIENTSNAFNAATGLRWQRRAWQWRTHLATGFRAPNIDDFAKFRENNGFLQIPNPELKPERSVSADLSLRFQPNSRNFIQLTLYRSWLRDVMVRENFQLPDGSTSFVSRGDTLFVQAIVNAESASVWGLSASFQQRINKELQLEGQLHYTYGRRDFKLNESESVEVPLDHIPPLYGQLQLNYRKSKWEAGIQWQFQARKELDDYAVSGISKQGETLVLDREGSSDNLDLTPLDPATGAFTGSYGWAIWNLSGAYRIGQFARIRVRMENLLDLHYRPFSSGISAPGRNLVVGLYSWF